MVKYPEKIISSYGLLTAKSYLCQPSSYKEIIECINFAKANGLKINPTGSRLSFSDVCLLNGQISIDLTGLNKTLRFDKEKAQIIVHSGVLTSQILTTIMPEGFTLIGLTGSLGNTVGGDIANDVNGKDSWKNGHFGENVISLKMITADGQINEYNRIHHTDVMNAVIGGMGLIGIIIEVTLKLTPIKSFMIETNSIRVDNIDELVNTMNSLQQNDYDFAYCWTDPWAPEKNFGRGFCETARFIDNKDAYSSENFLKGFNEKKKIGPLSPELFWTLFRKIDFPFFYQWAGYLKYFLPKLHQLKTVPFPEYQYPMLKYFPKWNLKYYPHGFREMQIFLHVEKFAIGYRSILSFCRANNFTPYICAIRKHKKQTPFLSFSGDGFSMTLNYGLNDHSAKETEAFENKIIEKIIEFDGKLYLGKFPFLNKSAMNKMYPELDKFLSFKQKIDSESLFWSDAAERMLTD